MILDGSWVKVFEDNFTTLNKSVWSIRGSEYTDKMNYSRGDWKAVDVSNKMLRLRVVPAAEPGKYLTGHIGTENTFEFTHGYAEARMRFHPYHGAHAALWLQGTEPYAPGQSEIDVAEYFGVKNPARRAGTDVFHNIYYATPDGVKRAWNSTDDVAYFGDSSRWHNCFNTFGVRWAPDYHTFYINDKPVWSTSEGITSSPKYVVLSMIARDYEVHDIDPEHLDTYKLNVDWVRVWQQSSM